MAKLSTAEPQLNLGLGFNAETQSARQFLPSNSPFLCCLRLSGEFLADKFCATYASIKHRHKVSLDGAQNRSARSKLCATFSYLNGMVTWMLVENFFGFRGRGCPPIEDTPGV